MAIKNKTRAGVILAQLRQEIDQVDKDLISLFEKRAQIVFAVGEYKRQNNLPVHDSARETRIKNRVRGLTSKDGPLAPEEMATLFSKLVESFRLMESAHMQKNKGVSLMDKAHLDFRHEQKVVLWGFGLLGSSFYLALKEQVPSWKFLIVDPRIDVDIFQKWKTEQHLTNIDLINADQMKDAHLYVLGAAVEINMKHLLEFSFPKNSLVIDLGSTKQSMMDTWQKRSTKGKLAFSFVGGHPLAGKEVSGFENGDPMLFYNKTFCWIQPEVETLDPKIKATCDALSLGLGAMPFWTTARQHDQALAWTSHLPQILGNTLSVCLSQKEFAHDSELFPGVVSELLRVGGSPFTMWKSILASNQNNLKDTLSDFIRQLTSIQKGLANPEASEKVFQDSNNFYNKFKEIKCKKGA